MACPDSDTPCPYPNYGGKGMHWYEGPVAPSDFTYQATGGAPLVESGVLYDVEEDLLPA